MPVNLLLREGDIGAEERRPKPGVDVPHLWRQRPGLGDGAFRWLRLELVLLLHARQGRQDPNGNGHEHGADPCRARHAQVICSVPFWVSPPRNRSYSSGSRLTTPYRMHPASWISRRSRRPSVAAVVVEIREAKARLEAAARAADDARGRQPGQGRNPKGGRPYKRAYGEPDEKSQSNFTDPESSVMKTSNEGFQQCYNAQVTVDAEHQLVVATDLTANASDQGELPVLLDAVKETFAAQPETVLADAGYCNERDLTDLEKRGIDGYVAPGREGKQTATRDLKAHPATGRMVEKLATPAGRTAYAERKWLSEAPNGWIKHVLGFRRFSLRGLAKVRCEWDLVCLALNVKRLQPLMAA